MCSTCPAADGHSRESTTQRKKDLAYPPHVLHYVRMSRLAKSCGK